MREENEIKVKLRAFVRTLPDVAAKPGQVLSPYQLTTGLRNLQAKLNENRTAPVEGLDD